MRAVRLYESGPAMCSRRKIAVSVDGRMQRPGSLRPGMPGRIPRSPTRHPDCRRRARRCGSSEYKIRRRRRSPPGAVTKASRGSLDRDGISIEKGHIPRDLRQRDGRAPESSSKTRAVALFEGLQSLLLHPCAHHGVRAAPRLRRGESSFSPRTWSGWIPVTSTAMRDRGCAAEAKRDAVYGRDLGPSAPPRYLHGL